MNEWRILQPQTCTYFLLILRRFSQPHTWCLGGSRGGSDEQAAPILMLIAQRHHRQHLCPLPGSVIRLELGWRWDLRVSEIRSCNLKEVSEWDNSGTCVFQKSTQLIFRKLKARIGMAVGPARSKVCPVVSTSRSKLEDVSGWISPLKLPCIPDSGLCASLGCMQA